MSVADLYEKTEEEIARLENVSASEAKGIRETLDEMVELVDDDEQAQESKKQYMSEVEDQIEGVSLEEEALEEEVEQVEYLICPSCNVEFEYQDQKRCPSCNVEFEFEDET